MAQETVLFKAEVSRLLDLVVNSLYSHKEIFLRELVSNASDAVDKLRYISLTNNEILESNADFKIKISADPEKGTLTISDNGIGMTKEEVTQALGTIAHSGTKEFIKALQSEEVKNNPELIGQFGVGFYAAFMVADSVTVITRKAGEKQAVKWQSSAEEGSFTVEDAEKDSRGTDVILTLKNDEKLYLDEYEIRRIIKKYSDYIEYPIVMDVISEEEKDGKTETSVRTETLNSMKAIWLKDKESVTEEEYNEFYKHISHDFTDPLKTIHYKAEGTTEFTVLLYIPSQAPFNILYQDYKSGPALYVRKVQIMDHCEELIPMYLRFIQGLADSSDLPLNVSREILQNNRMVEVMKKNITKKVLETLKEMKKNEENKYKKFFTQFGRILKEGLHYDFSRKEEIASLLLFKSNKTADGEYTDLDKYIENMKPAQEEIYYISGGGMEELKRSPYLESFEEKGYEVLFMTDDVDDIVIPSLSEYKGKKVHSVVKGDIDLETDTEKKEEQKKELGSLLETVKENLNERVKDVRLSGRLKNSVCCLVGDENDLDPNMLRMMEAMGQSVPKQKKILEINPNHPLFSELKRLHEVDAKSSVISDYSEMLYNLALIMEGSAPENPAVFAGKTAEIMMKNIKG
jgi:molecular chaperone HtpG